jgi:hypothetical protein
MKKDPELGPDPDQLLKSLQGLKKLGPEGLRRLEQLRTTPPQGVPKPPEEKEP